MEKEGREKFDEILKDEQASNNSTVKGIEKTLERRNEKRRKL